MENDHDDANRKHYAAHGHNVGQWIAIYTPNGGGNDVDR
jgi:hypothetical protein